MRLRSLLAGAALAVSVGAGSIALMAPSASAATVNECQNQQQCNQPPKCDTGHNYGVGNNWGNQDSCGICHGVTTPWEPNLQYVTNTTGETVTVTLTGKYYWIQTRDPQNYYPLTTTEVTLAPGESISVAWHNGTGDHSWSWTGKENCTPVTVTNPCPCNTDPCHQGYDPQSYNTDSWNNGRDDSCTQPCQPVIPVVYDPKPCNTPPVIYPKDPCKTGDNGQGGNPFGGNGNHHHGNHPPVSPI